MRNIPLNTIITLPRSGSHYLAYFASRYLNALPLTTNLNENGSVSVSEYLPHIIKKGLRNSDAAATRQSIQRIIIFSHPHHFSTAEKYRRFTGSDTINFVVSYPYDAIYSLYVAMHQGYRDVPTEVTLAKKQYEKLSADALRSLDIHINQLPFINSVLINADKNTNIYRYEDFNAYTLGRLFECNIDSHDFNPSMKRVFWTNNYESFKPSAIEKIAQDDSKILEKCYPEKLNSIADIMR